MIIPFEKPLDTPLDWVSGTAYAVGNLRINNGQIFRCVTANADSVFDPLKWEMKLAGGPKGDKGDTGDTGPRGLQGIPGVPEPTDGLAYTLIGGGTAYSVSKGSFASGRLVIPSTHLGLPVTEIEYSGFAGLAGITSIIFPDTLTVIRCTSFYQCAGLTEISIPRSVITIEDYAFVDCSNLSKIVMLSETPPALVVTIGGPSWFPSTLNKILVPDVASLNLYKVAVGWIDFSSKIITALTTGAGEFSTILVKANPIDTDIFLSEDSEDGFKKKGILKSSLRIIKVQNIPTAGGTTTLTSANHETVFTGSLNQICYLPACSPGQPQIIKNRSSGNITIKTNGTNTMDGVSAPVNLVLTTNESVNLIGGATGTDWNKIGPIIGTPGSPGAPGPAGDGVSLVAVQERVLRSPLTTSSFIQPVSTTAYFVYLGRTLKKFTPAFIELYQSLLGTIALAEVGIFYTRDPPSKREQDLTKIVSDTIRLNATGVCRNDTIFSVQIDANVPLWIGLRIEGSAMPRISGLIRDFEEGFLLKTDASSRFGSTNNYAGRIISETDVREAPDLRLTLD